MRMKFEDKKKIRRKPMNMSIREDIIAESKAYNINASEVSETALETAIKKAKSEAWLKENRDAIQAYNERVEREGLLVKSHWMD